MLRYRHGRTLCLGAGTGVALDLGVTDSFRLAAVDPSQAMLNELVRKHPLVARVEPMRVSEVHEHRNLAATKFDRVLALGGSGSYLTSGDWAALPQHAKGRYVLSVYAECEDPSTRALTADELALARELAREFALKHRGRAERVGRFEVVVVGL